MSENTCIRSGVLDIEWEIPQMPQSIEGEDPSDYISPNLVNTLRDGIVESGAFHEDIERIHGRTGILVHQATIKLLRERGEIQEEGYRLTYSSGSLKCAFDSLQSDQLEKLKYALAWVALIIRLPLDNELCVSQGDWNDEKFSLLPLRPVDWHECCFRPLFVHGIVATFEQIIPRRPLLKAPLPVIYSLTGVNYPVQVKGGFVLHGVFSVMVPTRKLDDGSIIWHVEINAQRNSILLISQVRSLKRRWYKTLDLRSLLEAPAFLGWAASGSLHLGTIYPPPMAWPIRYDMQAWRLEQANLQVSASIPKSITLAASSTYRRVLNRLWMGPPDNFAQLLENSQSLPFILYDPDSRRGWLVRQCSVLHEMVLAYANLVGHGSFLQAMISSDSVTALASCQDQPILSHGSSNLTIKDLVFRFATQLALMQPMAVRGGKLYGYRLMDIVRGMNEVGCDVVPLRPRPCWTPLLKDIPCLLGSNFGDVITGNRAVMSAACNTLKANLNFLASHIKTINAISSTLGYPSITRNMRVLPGGFWTCTMNAFENCSHSEESPTNCWLDCLFKQTIARQPRAEGTESIPEYGVVVFGSKTPSRVNDLLRLIALQKRTTTRPKGRRLH